VVKIESQFMQHIRYVNTSPDKYVSYVNLKAYRQHRLAYKAHLLHIFNVEMKRKC